MKQPSYIFVYLDLFFFWIFFVFVELEDYHFFRARYLIGGMYIPSIILHSIFNTPSRIMNMPITLEIRFCTTVNVWVRRHRFLGHLPYRAMTVPDACICFFLRLYDIKYWHILHDRRLKQFRSQQLRPFTCCNMSKHGHISFTLKFPCMVDWYILIKFIKMTPAGQIFVICA